MQEQNLFQGRVGASRTVKDKLSYLVDWAFLGKVLFGIYTLLIVCTFLDYGITYDEDWQATYGKHIIHWYTSGFQDSSAVSYRNLIYYGGFFAVIAQLTASLFPLGSFEISHLLNACFGLLAGIGVYKVGKLLAGPKAGFAAGLFLMLTPRFYGHAFNNPVDIPFATLTLFSIYYVMRLVPSLPHPPLSSLLKLGILIGLALGIRIGGILLLGYTGIAFALWLFAQYGVRSKHNQQVLPFWDSVIKLVGIGLVVGIVAYLVMLIWWPAAQVQPVRIPLRALRNTLQFAYPFEIFFEGNYISTANLPWYYISKWFLITLPEFYFIALAAGMILGGRAIVTKQALKRYPSEWFVQFTVLIISVLFPLVYTTVTRPVDYDEIRHYLFVIPPLAVLTAISLVDFMDYVQRRVVSMLITTAIGVSLVMTMIDMVQLHPNQYIYFNRFFGGGVAKAAKSFETDYWGNSYKEGVEWIVQNYKERRNGDKVTVASCLYSLSTSYFLPNDQFEYVGSFHSGQLLAEGVVPDLFLATPRWDCHKKLSGQVLHTVTRQGAPLLYIIKVTK